MERKVIDKAYDYCEAVTRRHARSFFFAAKFLPRGKRRALYPIYAFCRHVDDAIDEAGAGNEGSPRQEVAIWEDRLRSVFRGEDQSKGEPLTAQDLVLIAWQDMLSRHRFDENLPLELVRGVVQDTEINRYDSFQDLYRYCYRVASTVGLMASEVLGYSDKRALEHAEALGIAMQLTNILRDLSEDAARDRIYLPKEDLERFGVSKEQLFANRVDANFIELMRFEIDRARGFYRKGDAGIELLDRDSRVTVELASKLYSRILDEIERQGYDVFAKRAHTGLLQKLLTVPRVWLAVGNRR